MAGMCAEVEELYFLIKDDTVYLEKVSHKEAVSRIIHHHIHFFLYLSANAKSCIFGIIYEACKRLPAYDFHFSLDRDMWSALAGK